MSQITILDVGFGNTVPKSRVIGLMAYDSDPIRRHCQELERTHKVVDATKGRRVRSVVILDSNHIILSSVARETLAERLQSE